MNGSFHGRTLFTLSATRQDTCAQGKSAPDPLCRSYKVGYNSVVLVGKEFTRSAVAALHFVADEQNVVLFAIVIGLEVEKDPKQVAAECLNRGLLVLARKHPRRILHGLAPADLQIAVREEQGVAAEFVHSRFKRNAGSRRCFLKNHTEFFSLQILADNSVFTLVFELVGKIEYR